MCSGRLASAASGRTNHRPVELWTRRFDLRQADGQRREADRWDCGWITATLANPTALAGFVVPTVAMRATPRPGKRGRKLGASEVAIAT